MAHLARDVQSIVDLAKQSPAVDGLFQAVLALLENAPDKSIIAMALAQLKPEAVQNPELRSRAAQLLRDCDMPAEANLWHQEARPDPQSNVFAFRKGPESPTPPVQPPFSFADIGGLEDVKEQVRRKIIKPFQTPELFQTFKRRSGGGVLMYGPPGCGKTMLARALTAECNAKFVCVRASEILDMYVGVAEKKIANVFAEARRSKPTVLFFDEVEALAQRRQHSTLNNLSTIVSVLLNEMDGVERQNDGILFLAATNIPWSIDAAFRRPGRFDRTLFVPPPDKVARRFILNKLLTGRPHEPTLDREAIIGRTSTFSGADLSSLVETASDNAIADSENSGRIVPLNDRHFSDAFREVRPSTGEWLSLARNHAQHVADDNLYDDLRDFIAKFGR